MTVLPPTGVVGSGDDQDGQLGGDAGFVVGEPQVVESLDDRVGHLVGEWLAAQRIALEQPDFLRIAGLPLRGGGVGHTCPPANSSGNTNSSDGSITSHNDSWSSTVLNTMASIPFLPKGSRPSSRETAASSLTVTPLFQVEVANGNRTASLHWIGTCRRDAVAEPPVGERRL